jgi:hypothetical protein
MMAAIRIIGEKWRIRRERIKRLNAARVSGPGGSGSTPLSRDGHGGPGAMTPGGQGP